MNAAFQALTELSIDPFHLDDFMRDPDALTVVAGVRPDAAAAWVRCAICTDPGFDPLPDPDEHSPAA